MPPGDRQRLHGLCGVAARGIQLSGETRIWEGRSFCPNCGSRLFSIGDDEVEIKLGTLDDAPTGLTPQYELWIWRREKWLHPLPGARQFQRDRE